jgi:hypothetical protein
VLGRGGFLGKLAAVRAPGATPPGAVPTVGACSVTGSMADPRAGHSATRLVDGRVLIAGGTAAGTGGRFGLETAELYDPKTGTFSPTGSMTIARVDHTATLLADGRVLIVGGLGPTIMSGSDRLASAELYDPTEGTFRATGSLVVPRYTHTATRLTDGRVLIVGGGSGDGPWAELYDPNLGTFHVTGSPMDFREYHTAALLADGRVLVAGGYATSTEVFDPKSGTFQTTKPLSVERVKATATELEDGTVLVAGGKDMTVNHGLGQDLSSAELFDPKTGATRIAKPMASPRFDHTATLTAQGRVFVAGGYGERQALASTEEYDPTFALFTPSASLTVARTNHTATLLADGRVLIVGGVDGMGTAYDSAEICQP